MCYRWMASSDRSSRHLRIPRTRKMSWTKWAGSPVLMELPCLMGSKLYATSGASKRPTKAFHSSLETWKLSEQPLDKAHGEFTGRSQTLENDLRRTEQDCENCSPSTNIWKRKTAQCISNWRMPIQKRRDTFSWFRTSSRNFVTMRSAPTRN